MNTHMVIYQSCLNSGQQNTDGEMAELAEGARLEIV
jgi:hypothetical protein